uniref:RING-type E3 ubiquitin transferase n=1 Tax=Tetraselmis sp. GSL018 TaxID=582737 RepID=A0A061R832_9CHLO
MAKFVDCAFSLWNAQRMGFLLVAWSFLFAQLLGGATSFPRNLDNITHDGQITIFKADETYSTNEPKQAHRVYKAPSLAPPQSKTAVWDKIRQSNDYIQSDPPANVTGMYRGSWTKISFDSALEQTRVLRKDGGVAIFELRSHPSEESGLHTLEGDLVIRDGAYVTDDDIRMRVHGIYVPESGKVTAILDPVTPIRIEVSEQDRRERNAAYREALRHQAQWTLPGLHRAVIMRRGSQDEPLLRKKCDFRLDLRPSVLGNGSSAQAAGGAASAPPPGSELVMNGTLVSENCGMVISVNAAYVRLEEYYTKAVNYTLMITVISFAQVLLLIRQMEVTNTQASASKVSLLSIGIQAIMDSYLCLLHLTAGIVVEALFNAFATAAFFEFVIFAIFEMRYLLCIWRARRAGGDDGAGPHRELSILYTRFYGALLLVIFFAYQLQRWMRNIIFILYSFWIPQIVHCVRADVRQPLRPMFVLGMSATRLLLPLYLFGCPKNMLRVEADPTLCGCLVLWVALQAGVLLLQGHFGPRCFIPRRFLPEKYDYFHPGTPFKTSEEEGAGDIETGEASVECVICMTPVEVARPAARMVTPCNHYFHSTCLQRWMDVKMECPTCRRVLPPP